MVTSQEHLTRRGDPGPLAGDLDGDLLSLVTAGCTVEEIVRALGLELDEVHRRLVRLRLVIEAVSHATASNGRRVCRPIRRSLQVPTSSYRRR